MKKNISKKIIKQYWDNQPCNVLHSKKEIGSKEYFEEVNAWRYKVEPHLLTFADFPRWKGKKVLEIGCGIGSDAQKFVENGANYTGIELSDKSLELAEQRFKVFNLKGNFIALDAEKMDEKLPSNYYDLVYSMGVLHHTPNIKLAIGAAREIIKKNGEFRFMVYAQNSWKAAMILSGLDQPEAQSGCPLAMTYTDEDIYDMLDGYFEVKSITQDHIFMYDLPSYKKHKLKFAPWFRAMPEIMRSALKRHLGWHLLVTAKPIK